MEIELWFNGAFHRIAERKRVVQLRDDATFHDLIKWILSNYDDKMGRLIQDERTYFVLHNGHYLNFKKDKDKKLENGDIIAFVTIVAGG